MRRVKTNIDKLYEIVKREKKIEIEDAAKKLRVNIDRIEELAKILEESKLIEIHHPVFKKAFLCIPGFKERRMVKKIKKRKKKNIKKQQININLSILLIFFFFLLLYTKNSLYFIVILLISFFIVIFNISVRKWKR